ncbi:NAD-dependent epimerase/dehydratase family protein [Yinghuangia aomiensis]
MIVVTGATGNVGRALVELLGAAGEDVVGVARHAPEERAARRCGVPRRGPSVIPAA